MAGVKNSSQRWRSDSLKRFRMDGDTLVDTGSAKKYRPLKGCEALSSNGLSSCTRINSVPSLFARSTVALAATPSATGTTYRVRVTVTCRECKRRTRVWTAGWGLWAVPLLLKNWEPSGDGGTSISWELEPVHQSISFSEMENAAVVVLREELGIGGGKGSLAT